MNFIEPNLILKDLNEVLFYAKERFAKEFIMQEVKLNDTFKFAFRKYLITKGNSVLFLEYTTIVKNKKNQHIYIANQWFVIASYFVDFCTEMLTYRALFEKICQRMGLNSIRMKKYTLHLRSNPTSQDKIQFLEVAEKLLKEEFPNVEDDYKKVASYLWRFVSDYSWWSGSKTVDRQDFYVSPLLNQLKVVNASSEYLAIIVNSYASVLRLRVLVDNVLKFTIGLRTNAYIPRQFTDYVSGNVMHESDSESNQTEFKGISISAASLERFQGETIK